MTTPTSEDGMPDIDGTQFIVTLFQELAGPSKSADRHLARLFGWHRVEPRFAKSKSGAWIAPADFLGTRVDGAPIYDQLHGTDLHRDAPDFTGSIDAALSLIPARWGWTVGDIHPPSENCAEAGLPWAQIWRRGGPREAVAGMGFTSEGRNIINAFTPAIALCFAAVLLRAHIAKATGAKP